MSCKDNEYLEIQELIEKLRQQGCSELVDGFLEHDEKLYTKAGRLNKSAACRSLNWRLIRLNEEFQKAKEILAEEFPE